MARCKGVMFFCFLLLPSLANAAGGILVSLEFQEVKQGEPWFKAVMMSPDAKAAPTEATAELIRSLLRADDCAVKPEAPTTFRITPAAPPATGPTCEIAIGGVEGLKEKPNFRSLKFRAYGWNSISYELVFAKDPVRADFDKLSKAVADFAMSQGAMDAPVGVQMTTEHPPVPNTIWVTIHFATMEGGVPNVPNLELLPSPKPAEKPPSTEKGDRST